MNAQLTGVVCTFAVFAAFNAPAAEQSPALKSPVAATIQAYLDSLVAEKRLSGAVLVAKDGVPIASNAAGAANRATGAEINLETKFNLASMNKMFTAVAIAQLAQQGRLRFDDKVGKYLPEFPNKHVTDKVTLHQLLTHTSGLGSYWGDEFMARRSRLLTVNDHLPLIAHQPLSFTPGERFQYSNSGFMLLGAIVEKVSGENYHDYVRRHIYEPAGMRDTGFYQPGKEMPNLALGYTKMNAHHQAGETEHDNNDMRETRGGPAGGGFSTVGDLLRFAVALRGNKLLDAEHTQLITSGKVDTGSPIGQYAYGFGDKVVNGKRIIGHNGGAPGIGANLDIFADSGYTTAVMMNADRTMIPVVTRLRELIPKS